MKRPAQAKSVTCITTQNWNQPCAQEPRVYSAIRACPGPVSGTVGVIAGVDGLVSARLPRSYRKAILLARHPPQAPALLAPRIVRITMRMDSPLPSVGSLASPQAGSARSLQSVGGVR